MQPTIILPNAIPPQIEEVRVYFNQKGMSVAEADTFFLFYELHSWKNKKGDFLKSWKTRAYQWVAAILKQEPWRFQKNIH